MDLTEIQTQELAGDQCCLRVEGEVCRLLLPGPRVESMWYTGTDGLGRLETLRLILKKEMNISLRHKTFMGKGKHPSR